MGPVENCLRTVTGERAPLLGKARLKIQMGSQVFQQDVWIADIVDDCLLGLDFLLPHQCQLDLQDDVLHLGSEEIPLTKPTSQNMGLQCYRAVVTSTVTLPPCFEIIVPARVEGLQGGERWGIMERATPEMTGKEELLVGRTVVDLQSAEVPLRVMNLSKKGKKLKKGAELARCEELVSVVTIPPEEAPTGEEDLPFHLVALYEKSTAGLSEEDARKVRKLLTNYSDVFSSGPMDLGLTGLVKHHIPTADKPPIRQRPRRIPFALREEAERTVTEMHQQGVIEPSASPWTSPVVLARKKDGSLRFCVDYRQLNAITHKDSYPLPRIDETLESLAGSEWFSTLDLKSGYWQVELAKEDKEKTAFSTGAGLWQFKVMPFGLCNAPATFERLMERVLAGVPPEIALVYLDDILIHSRSVADHLVHLQGVLECLRRAQLKLSPKKCALFQLEVKYLGHIVSRSGVSVDPEKTRCILTWPTPSCVRELRGFLGLCSYYRRFVQGFADIARPLHQLTEKKALFAWTEETQLAFNQLKRMLTGTPVLGYPIPGEEYLLDTDASDQGIGAVLAQIQGGRERPIAYFSKVMSKPERQYCTTRKELLAVVRSIQHFRPYLLGMSFTVRTDHAALKWLLNFREPEGQIARWIQQLQEYNFQIQHRSGPVHTNADALSRRPCVPECKHCRRLEEKDVGSDVVIPCRVVTVPRPDSTSSGPWDPVMLRQAQLEDQEIGPILNLREQGSDKPPWQAVSSLCSDAKIYWAQCNQDVRDWCRNCDLCASRRGPQRKERAPLGKYTVWARHLSG